MSQLSKNPEFDSLIQSYKHKLSFNSIKFNSLFNNASKQLYSPLTIIGDEFLLTFDFGVLYNRKKLMNVNEIINVGINTFKKAVTLSDFENEHVFNEEDSVAISKIKYQLK
jgi:hypothetical protein